MSLSGITGGRAGYTFNPRDHDRPQRCCSLTSMITLLALGSILLLGRDLVRTRPACARWNEEVGELEAQCSESQDRCRAAEEEYLELAQSSCDWFFTPTDPEPEIVAFCNGSQYPMDLIPHAWRGMNGLDHDASKVAWARAALEKQQKAFAEKMSQMPTLCGRIRMA